MEEQGIQFSDDSQNIPAIYEQQPISETLHIAIDKLLPHQKELIFSVVSEERSISDIAREEGVSEGAVRNRLKKIYKKLKTFLD